MDTITNSSAEAPTFSLRDQEPTPVTADQGDLPGTDTRLLAPADAVSGNCNQNTLTLPPAAVVLNFAFNQRNL